MNYISPEGLEKLKKELGEREGETRSSIAKRISDAKELGDLSENAEYSDAREAQGINEGRIEELKEIIRSAVLVSGDHAGGSVSIGSTLNVKSKAGERTFIIVGPNEADPERGYISNESPLGMALLGRKKGAEVDINVPSGKVSYKILSVK